MTRSTHTWFWRTAHMATIALAIILLLPPPQASGQSGSRSTSNHAPLQQYNTDTLSVPADQILSGGPPKDGIPSLTNPKTLPIDQVAYDDDARMVVVSLNDATRAYPIAILNWHEAINDVIDDTPVAIIYCPLCDSVSVVDRRIGDDVLEFGISGLLHNSNVLLYDRRDNALWSQVGLTAISGPNAGKSLIYLPWTITSFAALAVNHPQATVVTRDTGHDRDYDRNPYVRYFTSDRLMFPVTADDPRLPPKTPVIGVQLGETTRAYPVGVIASSATGSITDELEGGHRLTLKADKSGVVEVVHLPTGAKLVHSFWFAWAAFHNDTTIYGKPSAK